MRFPSIKAVAARLRNAKSLCKPANDNYVDVWLQVYLNGDWAVRTGDSQYDRDHRGFWGCPASTAGATAAKSPES